MADSSDPFESDSYSSSSSILDSSLQDFDNETVFAWLTPLNDYARCAFDHLVQNMKRDPTSRISERKFIHINGQVDVEALSASGSEDQPEQGATIQRRWDGAFKFSTAIYPKNPAKGWFIGTGRGTLEVDVMICPPELRWDAYMVQRNHARLFIHEESCQPTVEALHAMEVSGATGVKYICQGTASSSKVLEDGHRVEIGRCAYIFSHGRAMKNGMFETSLPRFMKIHHGEAWTAHPILSATSTGSYLTMDEYTFRPGAFAKGTFGEVTAGWSQNGSVVAVKRFKYPNLKRFNQHMNIMDVIGKHPNIVELLYSSSNLEPAYPAIYCVYSPLAQADLADIVQSHKINLPAQIALLKDFLRGLAYLHDQKGIMHRDIKPENLGILSLRPPRGIILDLDAATSEETSADTGQGTISYQAPEIINLTLPASASRQRYGRSVDVWALGASAFCAMMGTNVRWSEFDGRPDPARFHLRGTTYTDYVTAYRLSQFHNDIERKVAGRPAHMEYFRFLQKMTLYFPRSRFSASQALSKAEDLESGKEEPAIIPRVQAQGTKRKFGEVG